MSRKTTNIVAYLTFYGFLIALILGNRKDCRFHLNQVMVITIARSVVSIIEDFSAILGTLLSCFLMILWGIGIMCATKDIEKPIPILGRIKLL